MEMPKSDLRKSTTASVAAEEKGKSRASRSSLRKGFTPKAEEHGNLGQADSDEAQAHVSSNRTECVEQAYLQTKVLGDDIEFSTTSNLESMVDESVSAERKRIPNNK